MVTFNRVLFTGLTVGIVSTTAVETYRYRERQKKQKKELADMQEASERKLIIGTLTDMIERDNPDVTVQGLMLLPPLPAAPNTCRVCYTLVPKDVNDRILGRGVGLVQGTYEVSDDQILLVPQSVHWKRENEKNKK